MIYRRFDDSRTDKELAEDNSRVEADAKVAPAVRKVLPHWTIAPADNNRAALEMLKARPYDLALTGEASSGRQDVVPT